MKEERNFTEEQIDNMTEEEWYWNVYLKGKEPFIGKVVYMSKQEIIDIYGSYLSKKEINKIKTI
jgi:hypothetical protein